MTFQTTVRGHGVKVINVAELNGSLYVDGKGGRRERDAERAYLHWLRDDLRRRNLGELTYVGLSAAERSAPSVNSGDYAVSEEETERTYIRKVRQELRLLRDELEGDEGHSARLTTVGANARLVTDVATLLQRTRDPIILLGDPGSGKSTTLREVGMRIAERGLKARDPVIPVYVSLGGYRDLTDEPVAEIMKFVRESIPASHPFIARNLDDLAAANRVVLIFDGMDEMERVNYSEKIERLSHLADAYRGQIRCLFACRTNDYLPSFAHRQIVLMPFNARQVRAYVENNMKLPVEIDGVLHNGKALTRRLLTSQELGDAATNPLTLFLVQRFVEKAKGFPSGRSKLFESYVQSVAERLERRRRDSGTSPLGPGHLVRETGILAFQIASLRGGSHIEFGELANLWGEEPARSRVALGFQSGLLNVGFATDNRADRQSGNPDPAAGTAAAMTLEPSDSVSFFHHRLQEYLCAQYIYENIDLLENITIEDLVDGPRWQETLLHLVAARGLDLPPCRFLSAYLEQCAELLERNHREKTALEAEKNELDETFENLRFRPFFDEDEAKYTEEEAEERKEQVEGRLQLLSWPLEAEVERTLANRTVLVSRLLSEPQTGEAPCNDLEDTLLSSLQASVRALALYGRPTSQIKMLWAWRDAAGAVPLDAIEAPLRSPIGWVREQALMVFGSLAASRRSGPANFGKEIEYDLLNGSLFSRGRVYLGAARGHVADQLLIGWAGACALLQMVVAGSASVTGLAMGWWAFPERTRLIAHGFTLSPTLVAMVATILLGSVAATFSSRNIILWSRWLSILASLTSMVIVLVGVRAVSQSIIAQHWPIVSRAPEGIISFSVVTGIGLFVSAGYLVSVLISASLLRAALFTRADFRERGDATVPFFQHGFSYEKRLGYAFALCVSGAVILGTCGSIFDILAAALNPWTYVLNFLLYGGIGLSGIAVIYLLFRENGAWRGLLWCGGIIVFAALCYGATFIPALVHAAIVSTGLSRLAPLVDHALQITKTLVLALMIGVPVAIVVGFALYLAGGAAKTHLSRIRVGDIRARPAGKSREVRTADDVLAALKELNPYKQAALLTSLTRHTVGLSSTTDLLILLEQIEPLIRADPALGAYWRRRHEVEEARKQEMVGPAR